MKPTFDEAARHPERFESRLFQVKRRGLEPPSSVTLYFDCPFCGSEIKAYLWSLSGGGKKCGCGALFTASGKARHYKREPVS